MDAYGYSWIGKNLIQYQPFSENTIAEFNQQQAWFDSLEYQREDLQAARQILQIPWEGERTIFRIPGMAQSQQLEHWQVVGMAKRPASKRCGKLAFPLAEVLKLAEGSHEIDIPSH